MDTKNHTSLLLTLGHNSSACLVKNGELFCGYEEERLTKKKSDSSFPKKAIAKCLKHTLDLDEIMISWWNDNFNILEMDFTSKHFDRKTIFELKAKYNCEIKYLSKDLTHHDAHAYSVLAFFENESDFNVDGQHIIVCDGFGNKREVLSVYKVENKKPVLLNKLVGYKKSLGLMYQYATSYCGMKMNQDEYKFLGYESKILDVCDKMVVGQLNSTAEKTVKALINMPNDDKITEHDFIDLVELEETQKMWFKLFDSLMDFDDVYLKRVVVGYFIQKVLELYFTQLLSDNYIRNVMLAGGVFYNVKLNNSIKRDLGKGMICVMPLAGDQGCGIGMYRALNGKIKIPTLNIGIRDLKTEWDHPRGLVCLTEYSLKECVVNLLKQDKIVNVVRGNMEFGPRALGNTSTFALPTEKNVQYINSLNERSTIMPMAPVMKASKADKYFSYDYVIGSLKYMIMTLDHLEKPDESILGICHKYPLEERWSSRAQMIDKDNVVSEILDEVGTDFLINTSYNFHGLPIVYDVDGAIKTFEMQNKLDVEERNYLVIGAY